MAAQKNIEFGIQDIRLSEFFVDESKTIGAVFDLNFRTDVKLDVPKNLVSFAITGSFMHKENRDVFMRGKVVTVYVIKSMTDYVSKRKDGTEGVDFPEALWVTLFSISYSHARALLTHNAGRSQFSHLLLPVINPTTEFRKLFGQQLLVSDGGLAT